MGVTLALLMLQFEVSATVGLIGLSLEAGGGMIAVHFTPEKEQKSTGFFDKYIGKAERFGDGLVLFLVQNPSQTVRYYEDTIRKAAKKTQCTTGAVSCYFTC